MPKVSSINPVYRTPTVLRQMEMSGFAVCLSQGLHQLMIVVTILALPRQSELPWLIGHGWANAAHLLLASAIVPENTPGKSLASRDTAL